MRFESFAFLAALTLAACTSRGGATNGGETVSSAGSAGGSSGSSSGSAQGSSQGTGTTTAGAGSANGSASGSGSSGSTTGIPPSPYADGGYVSCSTETSDAGLVRWTCQPGTYFCDADQVGTCFQCRGDSDCADLLLPTFDPRRPRCDLDSGIPGYQNNCVQCLGTSDCTGNSAGPACDLNPSFPPDGLVPPVVTVGFETCNRLVTDCRLLNGPDCKIFDQTCDPATGRCLDPPASCVADQDCQGRLNVMPHPSGWWLYWQNWGALQGSSYLLEPYCVEGVCRACPGGECPKNNSCFSDTQCGNPTSSPSGPTCDLDTYQCVCTSSSQCSGFWPVCLGLDGGTVNDSGQAIGVCSCDDSSECGDGGLICMPPTKEVAPPWVEILTPLVVGTIFGYQSGSNFCGLPCTSPAFPSCTPLTGWSICDQSDGLCKSCTTNVQCEASYGAGGPYCDVEARDGVPGFCGCNTDSDCPYAYSCTSQASDPLTIVGTCTATFSHCLPGDCGGTYFCNWDSGSCNDIADDQSFPKCLSDYDCNLGSLCIAGACTQCHDNADCARVENATATKCCQGDLACRTASVPYIGECAAICVSDQDCVGNSEGSHCWLGSQGFGSCGCGEDADCAGRIDGSHCVTNSDAGTPGSCVCATDADCASGAWCAPAGGGVNGCTSYCSDDHSCPSGFSCDSQHGCRPRCDNGRACKAPDPVCDTADQIGLNGDGLLGDAGDARWCYQCLDRGDCSEGKACIGGACSPCYDQQGSCGAGMACAIDGLCHSTCDAGTCPDGLVCDVFNASGDGANVCVGCLSPRDCPNGEGCNSETHTCGTCDGPTGAGGPYDCPPDAICSNYWRGSSGVCLQNCDRTSCPESAPNCQVFPALTSDHAYCFGCIQDEDCPDGGWCDLSVNRTFSCQPAPL